VYNYNVVIVQTGGCKVSDGAQGSLTMASNLLAIDKEELKEALTSRVMQTTKGGVKGTVIKYVYK